MKRKMFLMLLVTSLLISVSFGCSGNPAVTSNVGSGNTSGNDTNESSDTNNSEKKTISAIAFERGTVAASEGNMEDNKWTKWINENSPVNVNWIPVPRTESVAKTNALFASDTAPDLVWEFNKGFMNNLIAQGVIQPVDQVIEQYSVEYKQYLADNAELIPYVTSDSDGKMYAFTSKRTPLAIANHAMWIRQDWLDELDLSMPTTMEELDEVLRKFTAEDPDKNGEDDTFGLGFNYNLSGIMKAQFGGFEMLDEDGTLVDWGTTEAYGDYLSQVKAWYENGVIDPEYITDANFERQRQLLVTGKSGTWFAGWNIENEWRELKQNDPDAVLVPMESVETKYGKFGTFQEPPPFRTVCLNRSATEPEAVMKFMDWMLVDGWKTLTYGIEGEHYKLVDDVPQVIDPDKNSVELSYAYEYPLIMDQDIGDVNKWFPVRAAQDDLSQEYAKLQALSIETHMKNEYRRDVPPLPSTESAIRYGGEANASLGDIENRCITDPNYSVEQALKDIQEVRDNAGFDDMMADYQDWYDSQK